MNKRAHSKKNLPIKILLADDHWVVRQGLKTLLELEPDLKVVGEAENGEQAVELAQKLKPDVVLMDLAMPKLNGIEAARRLLHLVPTPKILVLSAYAEDTYIEKVMELGLSGYLIKQCSPNILVDAVHQVVTGKTVYSPLIQERLAITQKRNHHRPLLSERESQVLQLIAEGKANKQIASDLNISIKTVEKHRQNLMNKTGIHDTAGLTRYAIAEGYIECAPDRKLSTR